jgi:methylmalonyl-CoA mutase N-terminal domain/subunit
VEGGARKIVGVNVYATEEPAPPPLFRVDRAVEAQVRESLDLVRRSRDAARVEAALAALEASARDARANLLPPILAAVEVYATVGEICGRLERVFGKHRAPGVL